MADRSKETHIVSIGAPYGYAELKEDIGRLVREYPLLAVETAGHSVMGREIQAIRIGAGPRQLHYNGSIHANEWITALLLIRFIEDYAAACRYGHSLCGFDTGRIFAETTLWVIPMLNPDGVELVHHGVPQTHPFYRKLLDWNGGSDDFTGWKANIRGVDLNDQFPAFWAEERRRRAAPGPGPRDYTGEAPLTEPEALALYQFTLRRDFRLVMALHTQGEEIYWNYRGMEPAESETIAGRLAAASGYKAVRLTGSDAGYKDWFIQEYRRPGFTVEAGFGTNPLPLEHFPQIYCAVLGLLLQGLSV